jgi:hypothetical protein
MSPMIAFAVLTWAAIVVLFLGLAAVLREVRLLRGLVTGRPGAFAAAAPELDLGARVTGGATRVVLAADSGCLLCRQAAQRLAENCPGAVLLTHEPADRWRAFAGALRVVSDPDAWRQLSHLSPPVLMLVDGAGRARRMVLPVRLSDVDGALAEWVLPLGEERRDTDVHADS